MRSFSASAVLGILRAGLSIQAQEPAKGPRVVIQERLVEGLEAKRTIGPDIVHRYPLPEGRDLFLHVLVNQLSVDVVLRIARSDGSPVAVVDATNLGWESLAATVGSEGGFLDVGLRDRKTKAGEYERTVKAIRAPWLPTIGITSWLPLSVTPRHCGRKTVNVGLTQQSGPPSNQEDHTEAHWDTCTAPIQTNCCSNSPLPSGWR